MRPELERILAKDELTREEIVFLLDIDDPAEEAALFARAYEVKRRHVGTKVYFRGLIELSNLCVKNCFYCGIRRGNASVPRYTLSEEEVLEAAAFASGAGYGSIVLQSGERQDGGAKGLALHITRVSLLDQFPGDGPRPPALTPSFAGT